MRRRISIHVCIRYGEERSVALRATVHPFLHQHFSLGLNRQSAHKLQHVPNVDEVGTEPKAHSNYTNLIPHLLFEAFKRVTLHKGFHTIFHAYHNGSCARVADASGAKRNLASGGSMLNEGQMKCLAIRLFVDCQMRRLKVK